MRDFIIKASKQDFKNFNICKDCIILFQNYKKYKPEIIFLLSLFNLLQGEVIGFTFSM